ncbi:MAG: hypothetical protein ACFFC7_17720, partial [Candidatus Hermodarchaeota archaeon]
PAVLFSLSRFFLLSMQREVAIVINILYSIHLRKKALFVGRCIYALKSIAFSPFSGKYKTN